MILDEKQVEALVGETSDQRNRCAGSAFFMLLVNAQVQFDQMGSFSVVFLSPDVVEECRLM